MKKFLKGALSVLMTMALTIPMFSMAAFAQEPVTVEIPVTIELKGKVPSTPEDLAVVLTAQEKGNPMPEGSADGTYTMTVAGSVTQNFPSITYNSTGIYYYSIYQEAGTHKKGTYDESKYFIEVMVTNAENADALEASLLVFAGSDKTAPKCGEIKFTNSYKSSGGGGGGGGSTGGGGGTPSGGPGVTTISEGEPPLATILPFDIPLALPQTGTLWWLVVVLAVAGAGMFLGGMIRNKKHEDDDI